MTTNRRFAAFAPDGREGLGMAEVPKDGLCISTFLVIADTNSSRRVLVGKLNPEAPWDHIGAVNRARLGRFAGGWMLPSSHLLMLESPLDSAKRIIREQLEIEESKIALRKVPVVFSDVHDDDEHWDIGFVFRGTLSSDELPKNEKNWRELRFIEFDNAGKTDFVRFHDDVIRYALE
jgi:ADP-ribose pyrophosphatase YjhB (NUDIX family)